MVVNVKEVEISYCYVDGSGQEIVGFMKANVNEEHATIGYEFLNYLVRIWKNSVTGKETLNIPIERVIFVRAVDRY